MPEPFQQFDSPPCARARCTEYRNWFAVKPRIIIWRARIGAQGQQAQRNMDRPLRRAGRGKLACFAHIEKDDLTFGGQIDGLGNRSNRGHGGNLL